MDTNKMTDAELLSLCADAFAATPVANKSRKLLIAIQGHDGGAYAGNRSHVLANTMRQIIEMHLARQFASKKEVV
jgi:hypothetical protein